MTVAGIVLAAGAGTRFGGPKAVVRLDGERLVDRAVRTLRDGGCDPVIVVEGAAPLAPVDADVVANPSWSDGIGSSLRAALATLGLRRGVDAAVLLLVDTPWVGAEPVRRVVTRYAAPGERVLAAQASYDGVPGHPVLVDRSVWPEVTRLATGDQGARGWLRQHRDDVRLVDCTGTGDPRDVDRPEDLRPR
ncbi:MAG TPA: nucleotidyltransferase family protein [Actinomycetales bacterium]|nr:nucleotidyltransferase family protein [Actinomycetales bacterium]